MLEMIGEEHSNMNTAQKTKSTGPKNTKVGRPAKEKSSDDNGVKVGLNVQIDKDLRAWAKDDARRTGYSLPEYIEQLITERKQIAPPIQKVSLLGRWPVMGFIDFME